MKAVLLLLLSYSVVGGCHRPSDSKRLNSDSSGDSWPSRRPRLVQPPGQISYLPLYRFQYCLPPVLRHYFYYCLRLHSRSRCHFRRF